MCSHLFVFLLRLPTISFIFILFISLISSHSLLFSTKALASLSFLHNLTLISFFNLNFSLKFSHLLQWNPKSRKSSYVLSTDVFHLTRWNGAVRLTAAPSLTYRSQQHLLEGARARSVSFSNFSHFSSFPLIFRFNLFLGL